MKPVKDIYIFIGPPGSGKGSLSHLCKKSFGWAHLSTGNLCRQHIARMTDIGLEIDQAIKAGKLISDDLMIDMVNQWIKEVAQVSQGIILDGFPRTVSQARALDRLFSQKNFADAAVTIVAMNINDENVIGRLKTRFVCQNEVCQAVYSFIPSQVDQELKCKDCNHSLIQRVDDKSDVVYERLKTYHHYADDLLEYYRNSLCKVIDLNVELPLDHVFEAFVNSAGKTA